MKPNKLQEMNKLLLLLFLVVSCSPQQLAIENIDIIIIDSNNLDAYQYSDLSNPNMGWVEKENGDLFSYEISGQQLKVTASQAFKSIYKMQLGSKEQAECTNETQFQISLKDSVNVFRIIY